ncbi:MAG: exodeoxyribonuclease VII large subunit [Prevotella sp.]|jgi:exodeoxyribonuclease VII large subunit|nr:exodeoxyribonuclease VII large subunit [Prevotella sp.]
MQRKALTLYELNSLVRDVIETTLDGAYWVEAELSEAREVHGHCYMELVQKDLFGATPVARASAKCWRNTWIRLKPKFERTTGQSLHAGMKVMLLVTANFHEAYGFSWIVQDIDPTYTMGDMARKRLEIINQLKAEGVFDMQKGLELPMFAQHIAVISSEGAAGYGDFCHQLKENDEGFWFYTELFPAVMQGADVEPTVIAALDAINDRLDEFDVVVIIRGGGATADMSGFDTLSLAENVANFPIPVITGIGHDRDESVLDMVSHTRVKTPTAAAAFLVDHLEDVWLHINDCQTRLLNVVNRRMDLAKERLSRLAERIPTLFSLVKVQQTNRVDRLANRLSTLMHEQLMHEQYRVQALERVMQPLAQQRLTTERHRLEQLGIRLHSVDPALMLKRGYSITRINGKAVRDASQLKTGDEIETQLEKGTVKSKVV